MTKEFKVGMSGKTTKGFAWSIHGARKTAYHPLHLSLEGDGFWIASDGSCSSTGLECVYGNLIHPSDAEPSWEEREHTRMNMELVERTNPYGVDQWIVDAFCEGRKVKTRYGEDARIICIDAWDRWPVVALLGENGGARSFDAKGSFRVGAHDDFDLMPPIPPIEYLVGDRGVNDRGAQWVMLQPSLPGNQARIAVRLDSWTIVVSDQGTLGPVTHRSLKMDD